MDRGDVSVIQPDRKSPMSPAAAPRRHVKARAARRTRPLEQGMRSLAAHGAANTRTGRGRRDRQQHAAHGQAGDHAAALRAAPGRKREDAQLAEQARLRSSARRERGRRERMRRHP